jgi:hypothetical protein
MAVFLLMISSTLVAWRRTYFSPRNFMNRSKKLELFPQRMLSFQQWLMNFYVRQCAVTAAAHPQLGSR